MYEALRTIWEQQSMGWTVGSDGSCWCNKCRGGKHRDRLQVRHDAGCLQGIVAQALAAYEAVGDDKQVPAEALARCGERYTENVVR